MSKLIVTGPDMNPREFEIAREMTLGRNAGNDINIPEEKASRRHCRFRPDKDRIMVEDLESSNGTKVNGRKISTYVLKHGDTITIGSHTIVYQDEAARFDRTMVLPDEDGKLSLGMAAVDDLALVAPAPAKPDPAFAKAAQKVSGTGPTRIERRRKDSDDKKEDASEGDEDEDDDHDAAESGSHPFHSNSQLFKIATLVALVIVFCVTVNFIVVRHGPPAPPPEVATGPAQPEIKPEPVTPPETTPAVVTPPPEAVKPVEVVTPPPVPVTTETPVAPRPKAKPVDPAIQADWTKALAERDRAIGSGNFPGARTALSAFLTAHPDGETAKLARAELKDTEKLIESALETVLKDAVAAVWAKKYRLMTQYCTRLISADGDGKFGAAAREMLTKVDAGTEARYNELQLKASEQIKLGQLDKAGEMLEKALDELGGTKWTELVSAEQLQVLMARSLLRQIEGERAKRAAAGKAVPFELASRKINGTLMRVNGLGLEIKAGAITLAVPIKDLPPVELGALLQTLSLNDKSVELAYLWDLLERPKNAQAELERALQDPQKAAAAMRLVSLLPNQKNLKIYDFSKWQHQTDWDALSGSWSTQGDRYVLDSAEGGDTALKSTAVGGPFPAKNARISFDFELARPAAGYFFAFELGDEQKALSVIFSAKGLNVHANLGGAVDEKDVWAPGATHVDISISGNMLTLAVNGNAAKKIPVDGLEKLQGTITFRARETAGAIDNIILRNVE